MATISAPVHAALPRVVDLRRDLHAHPELGFQEVRTAGLGAARLAELGFEVRTGLGQTGVTGFLAGGRPGRTVLLRADMDALPLHEEVASPWRSRSEGVMHACGHDANVAIVLGAAEVLAGERDRLAGNVLVVLQPAEELLSGAARMLADGALAGVRPDACLAVHMHNEQPVGTVGLRAGPLLASADRLELTITGRGGHGALPHLASDAVVATAQVITALQTLVSRETPPTSAAVLSLTTLRAGTAFNIIPGSVEMTGTLRCYEAPLRERLLASLRRTAEGVAAAQACRAEVRVVPLTPALVNDRALTALAREVAAGIVGPDGVIEMPPETGSDDVAYFWQEAPGCYMFVGSAPADGRPVGQHHNATFEIDEDALPIGLELLLQAARRVLGSA
jgi:amidohydrolase